MRDGGAKGAEVLIGLEVKVKTVENWTWYETGNCELSRPRRRSLKRRIGK